MTEIFAAIGIVTALLPTVFVLFVAVLAWRAWWLYPAWGWFFVPVGLPVISFWHFTAMLLLVSVVTTHDDGKKDDRKADIPRCVVSFLMPMLIWAMLRWMR